MFCFWGRLYPARLQAYHGLCSNAITIHPFPQALTGIAPENIPKWSSESICREIWPQTIVFKKGIIPALMKSAP